MSGMDMSGTGDGMDMSSEGLFTAINKTIALGYWYAIISVVVAMVLIRLANHTLRRRQLELHKKSPCCIASVPRGKVAQAYATGTAIFREVTYSQPVFFLGRITKYFSPLPVGKWFTLAVYWTFLSVLLWSGSIVAQGEKMYAYKWEKVGFRAAWVSVTQIPFIFLLSCKFNPLSMLIGISYERLNWLHRWAARTIFLTVIVHWSFFFREWWLADFVEIEIQMMPMVKYGFGAFATIGWMILSGFGFFRAMGYEFFVIQHITSFVVLLWLLYAHLPSYAVYNVYISVGFITIDWSIRLISGVMRNLHIHKKNALIPVGYKARVQILPGNAVRLIIDDADFRWKAGQHIYLSIPFLRLFELHPFTIANNIGKPIDNCRQLTMLIKARSGFTKSLYHAASKQHTRTTRTFRAFLSGPWGIPPNPNNCDTVVLVACSTGVSFTTPILEQLVENPACVRRVISHWIIRNEEQFKWFETPLRALILNEKSQGLHLDIIVHITQSSDKNQPQIQRMESIQKLANPITVGQPSSNSSFEDGHSSQSVASVYGEETPFSLVRSFHARPRPSLQIYHHSRPSVEEMIRAPVEEALGETSIIVCGGLSITAQARTFVAAISDERAVQKGTGAQSISLHTEMYG